MQSFKREKNTEIDYLNKEIVNFGKTNGILTPVNSLIVELEHLVETTDSGRTNKALNLKLLYLKFTNVEVFVGLTSLL